MKFQKRSVSFDDESLKVAAKLKRLLLTQNLSELVRLGLCVLEQTNLTKVNGIRKQLIKKDA